jgi:hypothetical protein
MCFAYVEMNLSYLEKSEENCRVAKKCTALSAWITISSWWRTRRSEYGLGALCEGKRARADASLHTRSHRIDNLTSRCAANYASAAQCTRSS